MTLFIHQCGICGGPFAIERDGVYHALAPCPTCGTVQCATNDPDWKHSEEHRKLIAQIESGEATYCRKCYGFAYLQESGHEDVIGYTAIREDVLGDCSEYLCSECGYTFDLVSPHWGDYNFTYDHPSPDYYLI